MTIEVSPIGMIVIALAAFIVLAAVFAFLFIKIRAWGRRNLYAQEDYRVIKKQWAGVEKLLARADESSLRMAVVESDKLLDYALKSMVMPGNTLGERLKVATQRYPDIKRVWWAHKLRNDLVHEANSKQSARTLRQAVEEFRKTLKRLGAI